MFGRVGTTEVLLVMGLVLVFFGPRKLPEIGHALGKGLREFRQAVSEIRYTMDHNDNDEEKR